MKRLTLSLLILLIALPAFASETDGTVLPSDKYAWGDRIGWINFAPTDGADYAGLRITDAAVTGFAWSRDHGWVNFNPASSGQGVTNTPEGELGGFAWVASLGWISMDGVTINSSGKFVGIAGTSGTDTARVSFDCSNCSVRTDWRPASVRDDGGGGGGGGGGGPGTNPTPQNGGPNTIVPFIQSFFPSLFGGTPGVGAGAAAGSATGVPSGQPDYLFDISLRLERSVIPVGDPLVANTSYTSFGILPTPVTANYAIRNRAGEVVATAFAAFIVETERVEIQSFDTSALAPGVYTLHLRVVYGAGTVEEFEQPFTVVKGRAIGCWLPWPLPWAVNHLPFFAWLLSWFGCWFPWWILLLLILAYWTYRRLRDRDRERKRAWDADRP